MRRRWRTSSTARTDAATPRRSTSDSRPDTDAHHLGGGLSLPQTSSLVRAPLGPWAYATSKLRHSLPGSTVRSRRQASGCALGGNSRYDGGTTLTREPTGMRLTAAEIAIIRSLVQAQLGADSRIWLFGSRLADRARGRHRSLHRARRPTIWQPLPPARAAETRPGAPTAPVCRLGDQQRLALGIHASSARGRSPAVS